jgi:hypothetical protein
LRIVLPSSKFDQTKNRVASLLLDTSFVLRLPTEDPPEQAEAAAAIAEAPTSLCIRNIRRQKRRLAYEFVESGEVEAGTAAQVLQTRNLASAKPGFVDRLIHASYSESQAQLVSLEKSVGKLPRARLLS